MYRLLAPSVPCTHPEFFALSSIALAVGLAIGLLIAEPVKVQPIRVAPAVQAYPHPCAGVAP